MDKKGNTQNRQVKKITIKKQTKQEKQEKEQFTRKEAYKVFIILLKRYPLFIVLLCISVVLTFISIVFSLSTTLIIVVYRIIYYIETKNI